MSTNVTFTAEDLAWISKETPEKIRASMRKFREDLDAFWKQHRGLKERYPDKWIAFRDGSVVAVADSHPELLELTDSKGLPRDGLITEFLSTKKVSWPPRA